jgi:hypothetical protein
MQTQKRSEKLIVGSKTGEVNVVGKGLGERPLFQREVRLTEIFARRRGVWQRLILGSYVNLVLYPDYPHWT